MTGPASWEQKFAAIQALGVEASLRMRKPGDWYVAQHVEVCSGPVLEGRYGNGRDPQAAIEDHWQQLTNLTGDETVIVHAMDEARRRHVRWNGFMWMDYR